MTGIGEKYVSPTGETAFARTARLLSETGEKRLTLTTSWPSMRRCDSATVRAPLETESSRLQGEQNAQMASSIATRGYVLETGKITMTGTGRELLHDDNVRKAYLGG